MKEDEAIRLECPRPAQEIAHKFGSAGADAITDRARTYTDFVIGKNGAGVISVACDLANRIDS
jgi:hypothetical protein